MKYIVLMSLLLGACSAFGVKDMPPEARPATGPERKYVRKNALLTWRDHDELPPAVTPQDTTCNRKASDFYVARVSEQRFRDLCWKCGPEVDECPDKYLGRAHACTLEDNWGQHSVRKTYRVPVIVYHESLHHAPYCHEFGHILSNCSPEYGGNPGDTFHQDKRIFKAKDSVVQRCLNND